jgi:hypothetical protein
VIQFSAGGKEITGAVVSAVNSSASGSASAAGPAKTNAAHGGEIVGAILSAASYSPSSTSTHPTTTAKSVASTLSKVTASITATASAISGSKDVAENDNKLTHHPSQYTPTAAQRGLAIGVLIAIIVVPVLLLIGALALICLCVRRRRANKRRALAKEPKFYPEVSYLYDPPPGAPSPNPIAPNQAYHGAAGVAAGPEQHSLLGQNIPSARSVMAPLSGYSRAEQTEGNADLADREHLNPFKDNAGGQYRDSIDNQPRH